MVINNPTDLLKAINSLLLQMDRGQRKSFYMWIKNKRKMYDFNYPQGYKFEETTNAEQTVAAAPVDTGVVEPIPVIVAPENTGIIVPGSGGQGDKAGGASPLA